MSQKKVDYYKQAKANRKREEKKKNLRKAFDLYDPWADCTCNRCLDWMVRL